MRSKGLWAAVMALAIAASATAEETEGEDKRIVRFTIGSRVNYSAGVSEDRYQARMTAGAEFDLPFLAITADYTWVNHFQLSDGYGNFEYANLHQAGLGMETDIADIAGLSLGYRGAFGGRSYESHQIYGEGSLNMGDAYISLDFDLKRERYTYNWLRHNNDYLSLAGEVGYDFTDRFSMEADYNFLQDLFRSINSDYRRHMFHLGATGIVATPLFVTGGAGIGTDSSNYRLYSLDLAVSLKVQERLKISLFGLYTYYQSTASESIVYSGKHGGTVSAPGSQSGRNPYIRSSLLGSTFSGWDVSLSATLRL